MKRTAAERCTQEELEQKRRIMNNFCTWTIEPKTRVLPGTAIECDKLIAVTVKLSDYEPHASSFGQVTHADDGSAVCNRAVLMAFVKLVEWIVRKKAIGNSVQRNRESRRTIGGNHAQVYLMNEADVDLRNEEQLEGGVATRDESEDEILRGGGGGSSDDGSDSDFNDMSEDDIEVHEIEIDLDNRSNSSSSSSSSVPMSSGLRRRKRLVSPRASQETNGVVTNLSLSQVGAIEDSIISGEHVVILVEEIPAQGKRASIEGSMSELRSITDSSMPVAYTFWAALNDVDDIHPEEIWHKNMLVENMRDVENLTATEIKHMLNMGIDIPESEETGEAEEEQQTKKGKKSKNANYQMAQKKQQGSGQRDVADAWKIITYGSAPYIWDNYCGHSVGAESRLNEPFLPGVIDVNSCNFWTTFFNPFIAIRIRGSECDRAQSVETYWANEGSIYAPRNVNSRSTKSFFVIPESISSRFFRVMDPSQFNTTRMKNMFFPHKQRDVHILTRLYPGHFDISLKKNGAITVDSNKFFGPTVDRPLIAGRSYTEAELKVLYNMTVSYTAEYASSQLRGDARMDTSVSGWRSTMFRNSYDGQSNGPYEHSSDSRTLIALERSTNSSLGSELNPTHDQWTMLADDQIRSEILSKYHVMQEQIKARKNWQDNNLNSMAVINPAVVKGRENAVNTRSDPKDISLHVNPVGSQKELFSTDFGSLFKAMRIIELGQLHDHIRETAINLAMKNKRAKPRDMAILRLICSLQASADYARECTSSESDISDGARVVQNCKRQMELYTNVNARPLYRIMDPTVSPFLNVMSINLNNYYSRMNMVRPILMMMLFITALIGSKPEKMLRLHMLLIGPPGEGKTHITEAIKLLLCSYKTVFDEVFRVEETIRKSEQASGTNIGGKKNFMVQLCQEADQGQLNGYNKDNNQVSEGSATMKNLLDLGHSRVERPFRDPDSGEWTTQVSEAYYFCAHIYNANFNCIGMSQAILDRFLKFYNVRSNLSVLKLDVADEKDKDKREIDPKMKAEVCWQHKFMDAAVFDMHMLIKDGGMDKVTVWLATLVIQEVNNALSRANLPKIRPRDALRITDIAGGHCMMDAVSTECLMPGGVFTKEPIVLQKHLRQLNPRLYIAPRHIVPAVWMVTDSSFMPALGDVRRALMQWYEQNKQLARLQPFRLFKSNVKHAVMPGVEQRDADVRNYDEIVFYLTGRNAQYDVCTAVGDYLNILAQASRDLSAADDSSKKIEYQWSSSIFAECIDALTKTTYIAKRYHKLDESDPTKDPVPNDALPKFICSPIRLYKSSIGVSTCWLFNDQAVPAVVIRSALKNLFSKRHQPEERHAVGIDPVYSNTFVFDTYGHENCDDPHLELYKRINPHFEQETDMDVEYQEWYEQVKMFNGTKMQNVDMPLESIACLIRASEISYDKSPITERDIGDFVYNQCPRVLSEDTKSPYYGRTFPSSTFAELDDTEDLSIPRSKYLVPDENGQMVPHWQVMYEGENMTLSEMEKTYFEGMNHTIGYVVADRIIRNSGKKFSRTGLPMMFRIRFMNTTLSNSESNFSDVLQNRQMGMFRNLTKCALERREQRRKKSMTRALSQTKKTKTEYKPLSLNDIMVVQTPPPSAISKASAESAVPANVLAMVDDEQEPDTSSKNKSNRVVQVADEREFDRPSKSQSSQVVEVVDENEKLVDVLVDLDSLL